MLTHSTDSQKSAERMAQYLSLRHCIKVSCTGKKVSIDVPVAGVKAQQIISSIRHFN